MAEKNPKIEQREFNPEQPGKRLYFYPKHKTVAESEEEAKRKKLESKNPIDRKVDKKLSKKQEKKTPANN